LLKAKRLVCFTLLIIALMFPTSAFASTSSTSGSTNKSNNQTINQIFSFFSGNKGDKGDKGDKDHLSNFWEQNSHNQNKDCDPSEESFDIWKSWFCY
jgi:hypothetical protein